MNGNFKINPRGSHNLFELNKLICWSNYFKNTNTLPAVYSQRWRNKVASTLICIIFEKAPYTTPYKPPALHNGVKTYLKSQLIISYSFYLIFKFIKMIILMLNFWLINWFKTELFRQYLVLWNWKCMWIHEVENDWLHCAESRWTTVGSCYCAGQMFQLYC